MHDIHSSLDKSKKLENLNIHTIVLMPNHNSQILNINPSSIIGWNLTNVSFLSWLFIKNKNNVGGRNNALWILKTEQWLCPSKLDENNPADCPYPMPKYSQDLLSRKSAREFYFTVTKKPHEFRKTLNYIQSSQAPFHLVHGCWHQLNNILTFFKGQI